jgi:hypothetical protein
LITNSKTPPSRSGTLAIEYDRLSEVSGTVMSRYCPGKNLISAGSISFSTRWRRSW